MAEEKKDAAARKRSEASKKAAATRKKKVAEQTPPTTETEQAPPTTETEQVGESGQHAEGLSDYQEKHRPLQAAGLDQHAAAKAQEKERQAERDEHNRRTGDVSRQGWNH